MIGMKNEDMNMFPRLLVVFLMTWTWTKAEFTTDGIGTLRCGGENWAGGDKEKPSLAMADFDDGPDNNIGFSYLAETFTFTFQCCGIIDRWELAAIKTGTIRLHVWRRTDDETYILVGENSCAITDTSGITTCDVNKYEQILVNKGDFIGWKNQGNDTLRYTMDNNNLFRRRQLDEDFYTGSSYDWSGVESYNGRDYGIRAHYIESTSPTIHATDITVPDYLTNGTTIGRISYSDTDYMDNSSLVFHYTQTSPFYSTDKSSGYVTARNVYRPRDDVLSYYIYDLCYKDASASHAITVVPTSLVIDNLDATFMLSESRTQKELLHTVTCTDPTDQWYCYRSSSWDESWPFMLIAESTTSYGFYVTEFPDLDYDTKDEYILEVECVENSFPTSISTTATGTIRVSITENQPPSLTNLDNYVLVDASTARTGDNVFNVTATDPEEDILTYTMTCYTGGSPSNTFEMTRNGNVQLTKFLTLTEDYQFDCEILVTDTSDNTDGPNYLHISIERINHAVTITSIPPNGLTVQENMPVGTLLYTFTYQDVDPDIKTWSISYDDPTASQFFSLDPDTGELSLAFSEINFEDSGVSDSYTFNITVGDVKSSASKTFSVVIDNENEAPWFHEDFYSVEINEGPDDTQVAAGTMFSFSDEDKDKASNSYESHTFSLDCDNATNTQRFYIDITSGDVTLKGDYDLDIAGTPDEVACTVTVTDALGLSDTVTLYININNLNESTPQFTHLSHVFYISSNELVGTYLGSVSAVDWDSEDDDNNNITYTIDQSSQYAYLLAVNNDGAIYLANQPLEAHISSSPLTVLVFATNEPNPSTTGTTTITIFIPETTTLPNITTTDRNLGIYENQWSYYWLLGCLAGVTMMIVSLSLVFFRRGRLVSLSLVFFRICRLTRIGPFRYAWCKKGICCRPKPKGPRGFGDYGYDLASFGYRHQYADEGEEMDGWEPVSLKRRNATKNRSKKGGLSDLAASPLPVEADGRYGTPTEGYNDGEEVRIRPEPIYEMFRVPDAASYSEPKTRKAPRWKINERERDRP